MIGRILICLDCSPTSESSLPMAIALARSYGCEIQLLHVLESGSNSEEVASPNALQWLMARREAECYLGDVCARISGLGLSSRCAVLEGHVAEQVLCFADRQEIDLIVLSSHGEKGETEWSLASTTEKVLARTRTSVLLVPVQGPQVPEIDEGRIGNILLLLDGSPRAESVLPPLERLARERGATLHLLHVVSPLHLFEQCSGLDEASRLRCQLDAYNADGAHRYLEQIRTRLNREGCAVRKIVESGDLRSIVPIVAAREKVDLIAITSHGRTGDQSRCFGSTAGHLLRNTRIPVFMFQNLPQQPSQFEEAVLHRREAPPLRGRLPQESS